MGEARDLTAEVRRIIADQLDVEEAKVTPEATFIDDLGADSLALVEMVLKFEEEFQLDIPDEDAEGIRTVQDAIDYLKKHLPELKPILPGRPAPRLATTDGLLPEGWQVQAPSSPDGKPMTQKPEREFDLQNMRLALEQACMSRPSPNPPVGAVVLSAEGQVVAAAHHLRAGTEHAEVLALRAAGAAARGSVLYVTLEPCNHAGVTPPCVDAILEAGVKRVVIGCLDPNPHVTGGGAKRLESAGVAVDLGVAGVEARAVIAPWSKFVTTGLPHVSLKLASSLDGRIASRSGASKWVTGPEARAKVQELRAAHDAVAVGIGTAIADDPQLTVRDESLLPGGRNPTRVLFDTKLRMPMACRLLDTIKVAPVWIIAGNDAPAEAEAALTEAGCLVLRVPTSGEGRVEISAALRAIAQRGIVSVLFEGGAELAGSLLAARLADELHVFIAPLLLGPRGRAAAVDWAGPDTPADAPRLEDPSWEVCGRDAYVTGAVSYPERGG